MTKVFLSSTSRDLSRYREAVFRAIEGLDGFHCVRMEDFGARHIAAEEFCHQKIAECELVVFLIGLCFGSTAPSSNESYTILEFRAAGAISLPRLVFVSAEEDEHTRYYPGYYRESDDEWTKQKMFRQEVGNDCIRETFIEPHDLARKVVAAIRNWEQRQDQHTITQPDYFRQRAPQFGARTQLFDNMLCLETSLADLDLRKVDEFLRRDFVQRQEDFHPGRTVQDQLAGLELLRESHLTYGALLCFGSKPQKWLPTATTHCFDWGSDLRHGGFRNERDCRGDLLTQFENSLDFLRKHLRFSRVITSEGRKEQYEIPIEALQEALVNALVHREYARRDGNEFIGQESCVQVEIFNNRVEIKSPGPLPPQLTVESLGIEDTTHPRNPLIARIFYLYGLVEQAGSGIQRMQHAMKIAGLEPARFELSNAQIFKVILERPKQIPEEILESSEFGQLLTLGIEQIALQKSQSYEDVISDISKSNDLLNSTLIQKWQKGQVPALDQIKLLAKFFSEVGGIEEVWLRTFLKAAHYADFESLIAELYPSTLPKILKREFIPIWTVPYPRNPLFTGREDLLAHLAQALQPGQATALSQAHAISGLGGIGKTQLAIEYAYQHRQDYGAVLWVHADTRENLVADFVAMAGHLRLPQQDAHNMQQVAAVQAWLSTHGSWLLILDNADDLALAAEVLPSSYGGQVLLTTRAQAMGRLARRIEVDTMPTEVGALFLLRRAGLLAPDAQLEQAGELVREQAGELVRELGGLPLALDQAGAYMEETLCGLAEYLRLYRTRRMALLMRRGGLVTDHPASVTTTWSLAFAAVEQASSAAADLLRLCAFLQPDAIPEDLLRQGMAQLEPPLQELGTDELAFHEAVRTLGAYSLLRRDPVSQSLSIHRLVQVVLRDNMAQETQQLWAERVVLAVNAAFPKVEFSTWERCQRYLPHVLACDTLIESCQLLSPEGAQLLHRAALYLGDHAQYTQAELLYRHALTIFEQALPSNHPDTAATLDNLASLYREQGRYTEAEPLFQRALAIFEQALPPDHPEIAATLVNLAQLYYEQERYTEAEPLFQRALAISEQALGPDHLGIAITLTNLALLYQVQGRYEEAEPLYQRALAIKEQALPPDHPENATTLNNLALLYRAQGRYEEAEPLFQRALAISEQALGPDHPDTATTLNNLALLYRAQGRYEEAEPLYQRALTIYEQALPPDHPYTTTTVENYASLLRTMQRASEALPLEHRARAIRAKKQPS